MIEVEVEWFGMCYFSLGTVAADIMPGRNGDIGAINQKLSLPLSASLCTGGSAHPIK